MAGIVPKKNAQGVDFCAQSGYYYIVRSDLGCYMLSSDFSNASNLDVYSLHPSCQGGDHYLADSGYFYIIKGNSCRRVTNMTNDTDAIVYELHPNCEGGDYYLCNSGNFYIIFQDKDTYRCTSDMRYDSVAVDHSLHPNYSNGVYFWAEANYFNCIKPVDEWGVQFYRVTNLSKDEGVTTFSFHPDVMNFLPGGLSITQGPAFGIWESIKSITNNSETPITWTKKIKKKEGYEKERMSRLEQKWNVSIGSSYQSGALIEAIAKYQFSLTAEYGGKAVDTEKEDWNSVTEVKESVSVTLQPNQKMYVWQYKLGFGKEDVLFCCNMEFDDDPTSPSAVPLPPSKISSQFNSCL
nr:PREDICTED: uncharacterized protein LOC106705925 [Latimeria chalumnae]|eukprot:XP_014351558.1 PREDICTED: uncharacterized protein LOC106705925 [Latimeria chalumnae]